MSIKDEYEKLCIIGKGSYATIWKARHKELGYVRALKMSNEQVENENDPAYRSFIKECKVLLQIGNGSHPNIVHIYQPRLIDNRAVVEMDYVDGETLCKYLDREHFMPIGEVYKFINDIVGAMAYCHYDIYRYLMNPNVDDLKTDPNDGHKYIIDNITEQRLVEKYAVTHNDLHSNNIMRRYYDGSYMLLDFGLAITNGKAVKTSAMRGGALEYMSPEKFSDNSTITTQSDVYSLGIMLFEVLAGRVPFALDPNAYESNPTEASYFIMKAHKEALPPEIEPLRREAFEKANPGQTYVKDYPPELEAIIRRCLEKDPAKRYPNAKVLYEEIKKITIVNNGFEFKEKLKEAKRTIARLNETIKVQTEKNEKLQDVNDTLADTISSQKKSISKLKKEKKALFDENVEIASQLDLKAKSYTDDTEEIDRLKGINNNINQQLSALSRENGYLRDEIKTHKKNSRSGKKLILPIAIVVLIAFVTMVIAYAHDLKNKDGKIYELNNANYTQQNILDSLNMKVEKYETLINKLDYLDLGLPSGTLWKTKNESDGYLKYAEVFLKYGEKIPSEKQWRELMTECTWTWNDTKKGYTIIGKNGNSIFLPADGDLNCDGKQEYQNASGYYWSSTTKDNATAYYLYFWSGEKNVDYCDRCCGYSVRLVKD